MKVAIIGAGVSGLACALEFEKHGISPVIYERNSFLGEQHPHVSAVLNIVHRPIKDAMKYFIKNLGINIAPLNTVNHVVHYSPNKMTVISGNLGYFFKRDKDPDDVKNQLAALLKSTEIRFNTYGDYETLAKEYDYVVIANGTVEFTRELGCFQEWVNTYVKGAVVLGDFDPNTLTVWINKNYCKSGYAYMTPFNKDRASISIIVTDVNENEVEEYWKLFLFTENIKYTIVEEFKVNHTSGFVYPHKVGNIYFIGDAGGVIDPFLGFGQFNSFMMGVLAARSIAEDRDYEKLLKPMVKTLLRQHEFRKVFNISNNAAYDVLVASIAIPGLKHVIYYTPLNVLKYGSYLMRLIPAKK